VLVDVADAGTVIRLRVRQWLTLSGIGDYFFQIPAPVRDVRALRESQGEPGLRRNSILWQGFSPGRRVLVAELELDPKAAASALPLRLERRENGITLRNTTTTEAVGFVASARRSSVLRALARIRDQPASAPAVEIAGPTKRRRLRIEAPLRIRGTVEDRGRVVRRIRLVLCGARRSEARIPVSAGADVTLTAEPVPLLSDLTRASPDASGEELLLQAEQALFRLARVSQYRSFLGSPAPGKADAVYRFRTVAATAARPVPPSDRGDDVVLVVALAAGGLLAVAGALVLWAHL